MRYATLALVLALGACAQKGPLTLAYEEYSACLSARPADECEGSRRKFEAAKAYADSVSQRQGTAQPLVFRQPAPVTAPQPRQPLTCTRFGDMVSCY